MEQSMKINIRGVNFDNLTLNETVDLILTRLEKGEQTAVYTPNSEIVQACIEDNSLYTVINSAEIICPDGIGVIKAANILKTPLKQKVAGIEVGEKLIASLTDGRKSIFFLGGKPGIAEKAATEMEKKYPGIRIAGTGDGYFKKEGAESDAVIEKVNKSGADVLFVCLGAPAQEKWIFQNRTKL
ncbi:MAG: WecB/TagA/CpsF family glycosyltransferase, partial [Ruminococcaceae bacterium]|nr:WecB/TagA/CpsF family glycosyltransferase [Oscillospiraceae bacterium]